MSYISPNLPFCATGTNSRRICSTNGFTGSRRSHLSSTFQSKSRVMRPIPAPMSIVNFCWPSGHGIRLRSFLKNVEDPIISAFGTGVCSPKPPKTPFTEAGTELQYCMASS
ncbi:conserved hypothetical protein [Meyerozyma guilliermondii ATCC 6260]|uniref:Uncharacterized protein n=1 Tax=Meyerozyma guilliermondii (strain ATCC 6260 / CBS 566 / DSM 6381 / JCM 1539 / NBRC 10279 / NRRL Y-324) TaxID=294746 RepID=A5DJP8_PICGU|nr:uncharacterized protein PGUG_03499 [Meyerozyma guilliermondii ATCC 6260]EDK39400.2 conserved hypothetical protein [Meyerozyma guilliermondii ATCC 6260]